MIHLKTFEQLNELNTATYRSAANKLQDKHPSRAKELNDFAFKSANNEMDINIIGDLKIKLSDIIYYPQEKLFKTGRHTTPKLIYVYELGNNKSYISDRKSANAFRKMLLNGSFKLDDSGYSPQQESDIKEEVKEMATNLSVNDMYETE